MSGYLDTIIKTIYSILLISEDILVPRVTFLIQNLKQNEQKTVLYSVLRNFSNQGVFSSMKLVNGLKDEDERKLLGGHAALLLDMISASKNLCDALMDWLTSVSGDGASQSTFVHRAAIAAISKDTGTATKAW